MAVWDHVERVSFASPFRGEVKGDTATFSIQPYRNLVWSAGRRDLLDRFTFSTPRSSLATAPNIVIADGS
jgi:hypothetical protein